MTLHDDLLARRADYPVLERKTYLASHTLGAMHRGTRGRLADYTELWAEQGVVAWETWAPTVERVADLIPVALLAALVAVQAFSDGPTLTLDARALGLGFAFVALLLRAPFLVVVVGAAVVAALARLV